MRRTLTVRLQRPATSLTDSSPVEYEVAVIPLATPSSSDGDATLLTKPDVRTVLVGTGVATVTFELIPTDNPTLSERLTYRLAYREKYMGRVITKDFVMPDFDVDFDDLENLGNLIGADTYLLQSDLGRPGRVAKLNDQGQVVNSDDVPVGMGDAVSVQNDLNAFKVKTAQDINFIRQYFLNYAQDLLASVYQDVGQQVASIATAYQNDDATERGARISADTAEREARIAAVADLNAALELAETTLNATLDGLSALVDTHSSTLTVKADLVNGKVPSSQIPAIALGQALVVDDEAEMLALTTAQVQSGDMAVRPDGTWILTGADPSVLSNWVMLSSAADVVSVNGQTGAVALTAADVGARAANALIPQADITGLVAALADKATAAQLTAAVNRIAALEGDTTVVKTAGGLIAKELMPADAAFINASNLVAKKDGTVLNLGGEGGTLDIADVDGLTEALAAKVADDDARLTDARTPTAHKASHATGGGDALTAADIGARATGVDIPASEVTGLSGIISGNSLTGVSNHGNRINSLELRTTALEVGGGGGGGAGASAKTVWWDGITPTTDLTTVLLKSPFGWNEDDGYYYDPAGAAANEEVWPYISENGHLQLRKRNETNPPDPTYALQSSLDTLTTTVGGKAPQASLDALAIVVAGKAEQNDLNALGTTVSGKASQSDLNSLTNEVAGKAAQSAVDTLDGRLDTVEATLPAKADLVDNKLKTEQIPTGIPQANVFNLESALSAKADLSGGKVPVGQIPTGIPQANVASLADTLGTKADLVGGKLKSDQIPTGIPQANVANLSTTFAAKADLVDGKVPTGQLPSLALSTVVTATSRASMLSLTSAQVQPGDVCVITTGSDQGSYILTTTDPSLFANWTKLAAPADAVASVNGYTGTVVLSATDVGARSSGVAIPQGDISGLSTALSGKVDTSTYTAGLAGKTSLSDVQTAMAGSVSARQMVDYVATSAVVTSAQQSIDGTVVSVGSRVLLTAQPSSVNNGIWVVSASAWTRPTDFVAGDYLLRGTLVVVASGSANANTVWQMTANPGIIGTNANNWSKVLTAGAPPTYAGAQGVERTGTAQTGYTFQLKPVSGGGITQSVNGVAVDTNVVARRYAADVPAGSTLATITHNLGTLDVAVHVYEKASGNDVLVAATRTGVNTISLEFAVAPSSNQYRVVCVG